MKKWEYKVLVLQARILKQEFAGVEELNKLGMEGWELVAVVPMVVQLGLTGATPQVRCFLKREFKGSPCPKCGAKLEENAEFCTKCGEKVRK